LFEFGRVEELFAIRIGSGFRQGPAGLGQLGALQDEHGGPQLDSRRRLGIVEDGHESFQGAVAEIVELVAAGKDEFGAGGPEGGGEFFAGFHPAVDGDAMDAVLFGGVGEGRAGSQGIDHALLDSGEDGWIGSVLHGQEIAYGFGREAQRIGIMLCFQWAAGILIRVIGLRGIGRLRGAIGGLGGERRFSRAGGGQLRARMNKATGSGRGPVGGASRVP